MPRYHFRCSRCEQEFEEILPFGTTGAPKCPTCKKSDKVVKLMKAPMVHFKGTGFYKTDSSPKPKTEEKKTEAPAATPPPTPPPPSPPPKP